MDEKLIEYLDSLKVQEMLIDHENLKDQDIKEIKHFVSVVCKTENNYVDFVKYMNFSERNSVLFKNAKSRHLGAINSNNEIYQDYYGRGVDSKTKLSKRFKTEE